MNEYEECLYDYVMEHKFRELGERIEYVLVRKARDDGEQTLREVLTGEEKTLFSRYLEQESAVYSLELRHIFSLGLSLGARLGRL